MRQERVAARSNVRFKTHALHLDGGLWTHLSVGVPMHSS